MALPSAVEAFDMGDIFFFLLGSNVDTYCRRVLASSLSPSTTMPRTSLVVLVLFLEGGGCLLSTWYVSRGDIVRFILPRVLILFFCWSVPSETLGVNLSDA